MYYFNMKKVFSIIIFISCVNVFAKPDSHTLEIRLTQTQTQIDSLANLETSNRLLIEKIAKEISALKSKKSLGYFEHKRLENFLKESQSMILAQNQIQMEMANLSLQARKLSATLVEIYSSEIDSLVNFVEYNKSSLTNTEKEDFVVQIQNLRVKRDLLLEIMSATTLNYDNEVKIDIDPNDTPRDIEEKADLINDQEDKLRREADNITKQVKKLKDEAELRLRLSELVNDIRIFDQREEPMTRDDIAGVFDKDGSIGRAYWTNQPFFEMNDQTNSKTGVQFNMGNLSELSYQDLEDLVSNLELRSHRLIQRADSLNVLAKDFRNRARKMLDVKKQEQR